MGNQLVQPLEVVISGSIDSTMLAKPVALLNASGQIIDPTPQTGANLPFAIVTTPTVIGTAAKVTTSPEPAANTLVVIKFTNGNTAASPTVAFNGGTARVVQLGGAAPAAIEATIAANGVGLFFFDGTILHQVGVLS